MPATIPLLVLMIWDRRIVGALKNPLPYQRSVLEAASSAHRDTTWFRMGTLYSLFLVPTFIDLFADRWGLALGMPVMAILVYAQRKWFERPYTWWSAALLGLAGLPLSLLPVPVKAQQFVAILAGGIWLLGQGGWKLAGFLRARRSI